MLNVMFQRKFHLTFCFQRQAVWLAVQHVKHYFTIFFLRWQKFFCQKMMTLKGAEPGVLCPFVILQIVH